MDEEQPVFEQVILSDFKMWSSTALKTFNNDSVVITNISRNNECGAAFSVTNFGVNSAGCSDKFHVVFEHFEDLKHLILNILKEKLTIYPLVGSYNLKFL